MPPLKTGSGIMYKIILWDFDGTLTNFKHAQKHAIKAMFERLELGPCDDEAVDRYDEINEKYWRLIETGKYDKEHCFYNASSSFLKNWGCRQMLLKNSTTVTRSRSVKLQCITMTVSRCFQICVAEFGSTL